MSLWDATRNLASTWYKSKKRSLEGTPSTKVDSGGTRNNYSFNGQEISQSDLREVKEIRESGGAISQLVHQKALLMFGTGIEWESENEDVAEYLRSEFNDIDNLIISLGEDAIWYPYSAGEIVETRGGGFSHLEAVEPWTLLPETNDVGEIIAWQQQIQGYGNRATDTFAPDDLAHFVLNKSSARDKTGISEVLRAEDEITSYRKNQEAINQAVDQAAYRRHWWKIGRQGAGVIDDNELRRVRNRVSDLDGDTVLVTGQDVEHELMDAMSPEAFKTISELDMRNMLLALGLPIELGSVISEGLGSGEQSGVRMQAFLYEAKAKQRALADQFVQNVVRPVLRDYTEFDSDVNVEMRFGEPLSDEPAFEKQTPYMSTNEIRERIGKPPLEDDELGESFRKPANIQAPEEEEPEEGGGGIGGLFGSEGKALQDVEDIDTGDYPEAAVENARMALEAREETGNPNDCGTQVGWERANQLVNGEDLSEDTISRMAAFERHESNKNQGEEGRADCGWMMWKAWGGSEGIEWAQSKMEEFEEARRENAGGSENPKLAAETSVEELDAAYDRLHREFVTAEDTGKQLTAFSEGDLPEMVIERMKQAIRGGALFSDFDNIPSAELMELREYFADTLSEDGWSLDEMRDEISGTFGVSRDNAETIARTETQAIVNQSAEDAYKSMEEERGEEFKYKWVGSTDSRTTDACKWLLGGTDLAENISGGFEGTNPEYGGTPVSLDRMKELVQEAAEKDPDVTTRARAFTPHINCRKRYVRVVE